MILWTKPDVLDKLYGAKGGKIVGPLQSESEFVDFGSPLCCKMCHSEMSST